MTPQVLNKLNNNRRLIAITFTCFIGWGLAFLGTEVFRNYAWGLFIWLPIVMGVTSSVVYGFRNPAAKNGSSGVAFISLGIFCAGLLLFAWEGLICLAMAAPIGLFFTWAGHLLGNVLVKSSQERHSPSAVILFIFSVPVLMAFENEEEDSMRSVTTSIEIKASPEQVWKNVIAFPQLDEPTEFIFNTGIAYPINATIEGNGVGAVRHCNFSTGSFIEPITVWNESRLLKFSVTDQPAPMKELSIYDIQPNHLHGYWVSKEGQFKLTKLPNGNTLLEGTTWYMNKIKPDFYWTIWSDYIVHQIHQRVLAHIKKQTEKSAMDRLQ